MIIKMIHTSDVYMLASILTFIFIVAFRALLYFDILTMQGAYHR